jgi:hypothetical protein
MTTQNKTASLARSITDRLTSLAGRQKVPFDSLLSSFLLERMAARLVADPTLARSLVFKGGYVSLRVYSSPRFTNDLDALLRKGPLAMVQKSTIAALEADNGDGVWFRFVEAVDLETQGEYGGLRLTFRCGLGELPKNLAKARRMNFDIGTGDVITPAPVKATIPILLGQGEISWSVYPVETICSEKLHALVVREDNSRAKDVFDLSLFLPRCEAKAIRKAIDATFAARGDALPESIATRLKELDTTVLKRGWRAAVQGIPASPNFDDCFNMILVLVAGL